MGPERAPRHETDPAACNEADPAARARTFVVNSLGARAQSVAEIEAKLTARGIPPDVARAAVAEATRLGYLDDAELAGQLARGLRSRGYGPRRAAQALRRRGVSENDARVALDAAYGEADETALARAALGARPTRDAKEREKAVAYLVRRGFATSAAREVVRERPEEG
jgi:regulatory protein